MPGFIPTNFNVGVRKSPFEGLVITWLSEASVVLPVILLFLRIFVIVPEDSTWRVKWRVMVSQILFFRICLTSPENSVFEEFELPSGEIGLLESPASCPERFNKM